MNDENQENEALKGPVILTVPACVTAPGYGFLIALNPDWCFTSQERKASPSTSVSSRLFSCARRGSHHSPKAFRIAQNKRHAGG